MTFYSVLGSVQLESEPPMLVNEGEASDLDKRWVYKNESHGKLLKAPKMVLLKVWQGVHFYINISWPKSNTSVLTPLECSFLITHCQKWGKTPYQNMWFWMTSRINLIFYNLIGVYELKGLQLLFFSTVNWSAWGQSFCFYVNKVACFWVGYNILNHQLLSIALNHEQNGVQIGMCILSCRKKNIFYITWSIC